MKLFLRAAIFCLFAGAASAALPYIARAWAWNIGDTSAGLTVEISALDQPTDVYFLYGTDPYLSNATRTGQTRYDPGTIGFQANVTLSGLARGTTYYFKAVTSSLAGNVESSVVKFTTTGTVAPVITRATSWDITDTTAALSMDVVAIGLATEVYFLYGTDRDLIGSTRVGLNRSTAASAGFQSQTTLTGLSPRTTYYYRAVVNTLAGSAQSPIGTFTTRDKQPDGGK